MDNKIIAIIRDQFWGIESIYKHDAAIGTEPAFLFGGEWILIEEQNINGHIIKTWQRNV